MSHRSMHDADRAIEKQIEIGHSKLAREAAKDKK